MTEILALILAVLASVQCADEGRVSQSASERIRVESADVLKQLPPRLVLLGAAILEKKGSVPDEVCKAAEQSFGGEEM